MEASAVALAAIAVVMAAAAVHRLHGTHSPQATGADQQDARPSIRLLSSQIPERDSPLQLGSNSARITIMEFSDFQCPFCARAAAVIDSERARHIGLIRVQFRHFPLRNIHPFAFAAAIGAECAAEQNAFESYYHVLFHEQGMLGVTPWTTLAERAGIADTAAFSRCLSDGEVRARVDADIAAGRGIQIRGTPTIIVGRTLLDGAPSMELLDSILAARLR
jgi:protein-disulfide isomerase